NRVTANISGPTRYKNFLFAAFRHLFSHNLSRVFSLVHCKERFKTAPYSTSILRRVRGTRPTASPIFSLVARRSLLKK
ncbi:MAG TPA: hypothetical protein PKJ69_09620, partial [Spirochaetota bacterium]|nr:hypothetical protein [Spirochaetota bacterium]